MAAIGTGAVTVAETIMTVATVAGVIMVGAVVAIDTEA